jgi:PRTRC genetic system protein B
MALAVSCSNSSSSAELAAAILLYKNGKEVNFVSVHDIEYINGEKSQPYIGVGKPASKGALSELVKDLVPSLAAKRTVMPANVLSYDFEHLAWYVPPSKRQLWFNHEKFGGKVSASIDLPGLVFFVGLSGWYVFALDSKERPTADTALMVSPFLNVWGGGKICTGNIDVPKIKDANSYLAFEEAFFRSYFTHINIHEKDRLVKFAGGPYKLWSKLINGQLKKFPVKALVPAGVTVGEFLLNLDNNGRD